MIVPVLVLLCFQMVWAQNSKASKQAAKIEKIKKLMEAQNYVFRADYVVPQRGNSRPLSYGYCLTVSKDTLDSYLPYFGRATSAPLDPADGGIKLNTTQFDYKSTTTKKGGYDIVITPKETQSQGSKDIRYFRLSVGATGYSTLQVTSNNRDPISFNGYVEEKKTKK